MKNSDIEKYYFEIFMKYSEVPSGEIIYTDKPDVIIKGSKTVGIEISNLYIKDGGDIDSEQVQKERRKQVIDNAHHLFLTLGGKNIELHISFDTSKPIVQIDPIATALANFALEIQDLDSGQIHLNSHSMYTQFTPEINWIYINSTEYVSPKWHPLQSYSTPILSVDRVNEVVETKNLKISDYQKCDVYWLLLIVDLMDPAQDQQMEWSSSNKFNESPFSKIILFKPQYGETLFIK